MWRKIVKYLLDRLQDVVESQLVSLTLSVPAVVSDLEGDDELVAQLSEKLGRGHQLTAALLMKAQEEAEERSLDESKSVVADRDPLSPEIEARIDHWAQMIKDANVSEPGTEVEASSSSSPSLRFESPSLLGVMLAASFEPCGACGTMVMLLRMNQMPPQFVEALEIGLRLKGFELPRGWPGHGVDMSLIDDSVRFPFEVAGMMSDGSGSGVMGVGTMPHCPHRCALRRMRMKERLVKMLSRPIA